MILHVTDSWTHSKQTKERTLLSTEIKIRSKMDIQNLIFNLLDREVKQEADV